MLEIQNYAPEHFNHTREICYETSTSYHTPEKQSLLWLLYHDYYPQFSMENCFVAFDTVANRAIGYILCEPNFSSWERNYKNYLMDKLEKLSPEHAKMRLEEFSHYRKIAQKFPAHLHINILPAYQGQGIGGQLLSRLHAHLTERGCEGIFLTTSPKKVPSIKLYERNGYTQSGAFDGGAVIVFTKRLQKN